MPTDGCRTRLPAFLAALVVILLAVAAPAAAVPPQNDSQFAPGAFTPYTAENGTPRDLQAVAEPAEATADGGVPRCLGPTSFARTVWYVVPAAETPQEITVEASGRTLDVVDLAAFVQPEGATGPSTAEPNACSGLGAGGSDASEEPTSAVTLRVPARRAVLVQVGRRGPVGTPDDERVVLSLDARSLALPFPPAGDIADPIGTPRARVLSPTFIQLDGSTTTEEDPAEPPCPSLGSVWRRWTPSRASRRVIRATGSAVATLTVYQGTRPTGTNALDCVNRGGNGRGALQMLVKARGRRTVWIRLGTDRPPDAAEGTLRLEPAPAGTLVVDGGPGGFDPTTGGPGGGLPSACAKSRPSRARVGGTRIAGSARSLNRRLTVPLRLSVRGSRLCDVRLELRGPRGHVYAQVSALHLRGRRLVRLYRVRRLVKGTYRLRLTAVSGDLGVRERVRSTVRGRLRAK